MVVSMWVATGLLAVAIILSLIRLWTGKDAATCAATGDLVFFSAVGILIIQGVMLESEVSVDLAMYSTIIGILATIALARIVTRGRR